MVSPDTRPVINGSEVAAQVIDGEAIIMNLSTGIYCSMDRVGAVVWGWIERGHTVGEIADGLAARFEISPEQARADVERLIGQLVEDDLIQLRPAGNGSLGRPATAGEPQLPYVAPELHRYGDMADLLALDPPMPVLPPNPSTNSEEKA